MFVLLVCFGLYIDVLSVSMRFNIIFCIYENIKNRILILLENMKVSSFGNFVCTKNGPK